MDTQNQLLALTDRILLNGLEYIAKTGTFTDIVDFDGRGGVRTQRLSNAMGLGEIRQIRSQIRKELGLDQAPTAGSNAVTNIGTPSLLSLIQSGKLGMDQLHNLGTRDE